MEKEDDHRQTVDVLRSTGGITAVNGTTATAEVISYIPSQVVGEDNASYKWAKYAWNSVIPQ